MELSLENKDDLREAIRDMSLDELALDFDNFISAATPFLIESDVHGLNFLNAINVQLTKISGQENAELWTEDAFFTDENWKSIKEKAQLAIRHFSWN